MLKKVFFSLKTRGVTATTQKVLGIFYLAFSRLASKRFVRSMYGPLMVSHFDDATFRFCISAAYGRTLSDALINRREPFIFIDIGANQGLYTLIAARNPNCAHCIAFEPVASTHKLLRSNLSINRLRAKTSIVKCAISDQNRSVPIYFDQTHTGTATLQNHGKSTDSTILIECRQAKTIVELQELGNALPIFIKIDTEGHEQIVLSELQSLDCWPAVSDIFIELDDRWVSSAAIDRALLHDGFEAVARTPGITHYDVLYRREPLAFRR